MKFTTMQGTGNDFIVIDQRDKKFNLSKSLIRKLSDRYYGIGFDPVSYTHLTLPTTPYV